jgi:hypothetical protein
VLKLKPLTWAILLLIPVGTFAAEVYRSVNADGIVVYSDRPVGTAGEEQIDVRTSEAVSNRAAAQSPADAETAAAGEPMDDSLLDGPLTAEFIREPTPDEVAADRERNCAAARSRNEGVSTAHRLFRNTADGEREYLSAEEIDRARAKAAADVAAWCD